MKMQLVVIAALAALAASHELGYVQVCGRNLAQLLDNLCGEPEAKLVTVKRVQPNAIADFDSAWPWMRPSHAKALAGSRGKRPVATECCLKSCSIGELLSYC
ncbi:insulin-related peptide 4-like [Epargyreus clarus]|uniref:insulin-related peptide 4-like n=1 Tax=Epargyreus clarus TaxID=520877 RepID=UPI003C2B2797